MKNQTINETNEALMASFIFDSIAYIIGYYMITAISAIGLVINTFTLKVLSSPKLKHSIYNYFWCRSFCDLLVCAIGVTYLYNSCVNCEELNKLTYSFQFYRYYFLFLPMRILFLASSLAEIYLLLNRCLILYNIENILSHVTKLTLLSIFFSSSFIVLLPPYFSLEIKETDTNLYSLDLNEFGRTNFYKIYVISAFVLESFIPLLFACSLSFIALNGFRKLSKKKSQLLNKSDSIKQKKNLHFTRIILIITLIFVFTRVFDLVSFTIMKIYYIYNLQPLRLVSSLINFFLQLNYFCMFLSHSMNGILFGIYDRNLFKIAKSYFK